MSFPFWNKPKMPLWHSEVESDMTEINYNSVRRYPFPELSTAQSSPPLHFIAQHCWAGGQGLKDNYTTNYSLIWAVADIAIKAPRTHTEPRPRSDTVLHPAQESFTFAKQKTDDSKTSGAQAALLCSILSALLCWACLGWIWLVVSF